MNEMPNHDLLIEIHTLLHQHVKRFEEHVLLDDRREAIALEERRIVAEELKRVNAQQSRVLSIYSVLMAVAVLVMKFWK